MKDLLSKEHYCYKTQRSLIKKMTSSVKRQKGECQNGCFKKTKHTKFSEKRAFLTWNTRIKICPSALLLTTYFLYKKSRAPPSPPLSPPTHTHTPSTIFQKSHSPLEIRGGGGFTLWTLSKAQVIFIKSRGSSNE